MNAHQRRLQSRGWYQRVLKRLEEDKDRGQGLWWCPHYLDCFEDGTPKYNQGIDFNFLGVDQYRNKSFAGSLDTVMVRYINAVEDIVYDEQDKIFPWPEGLDHFIPVIDPIDGKEYFTFADPFNGEERIWRENRILEIYSSGDVLVFEEINIKSDYDKNSCRIGLFAAIAKNHLGSQELTDFIHTFRNMGQVEFKGTVPYSFSAKEIESWNGDKFPEIHNLQPSEIMIKL